MKLLRVGDKGKEKPAILDKNNKIKDISSIIPDLNPNLLNFETISKIEKLDLNSLKEVSSSERIGPCVKNPGKFVAIGLNYSDHAEETGNPIPTEPIVFMKATSCINGPNDNIEIKPNSKKLDWEVELGIIIGKECKDIKESEYLLCTGLFDDYDEDLIYYKNLFENHINKKMICTNPDLIVDRGNKRELCAGSVAIVFEKMGGEVVYFGKPHPEVYNQSIDNNNKKILSIGDNLNTDIKGANLLNYDSLLISNGIHKDEIKDKGIQQVSKEYETIINFIQSDLKW